MTLADCEGLSAQILEAGGFDGSPNPWQIVECLKQFDVRYGEPGARPRVEPKGDRWKIILDPSARPESQALTALHEASHVLNASNGIRDTEQHAWWTALALMFPRPEFRARRRRHGWAVDELLGYYPWSSHEACARRIVMMERALLWVWDAIGPRPRRYLVVSPECRWACTEPTPVEIDALHGALEDRCAVEPLGGVRAWAVEDPPWVRVLCLSDLEVVLPQVRRASAWP